jgi:uncharacterized membrane protein YdjX (TVP38/TMEM64 family)
MSLRSWPDPKPRTRDWRALALAFFGFGGVGLLLLGGARVFGLNGADVQAWLTGFADSPWGLAAAIGVFAALAFVGAPQFVLIAAVVAAFGPWRGAAYSWAGTMVSAAVGFGLGRRFAGDWLVGRGARGLRRFVAMIGRNGFAASLLVRLVPAAPFVLVNMAAGATPMAVLDFLAGTAAGIVPKIAVTALAAAGVGRGDGVGRAGVLIVAAVFLWLLIGLVARRWMKGWNISDVA